MSKALKIISSIFALVGALFIIIGVYACINTFSYDNAISTTGIITRIEKYRDHDGDTSYDVYVTYEVDNMQYESKLGGYLSSFAVGDEIDIYYDKDNPTEIGNKTVDYFIVIIPALGLVFFSIGLFLIISGVKEDKKIKKLKLNGICIYAKYVETTVNTMYSVNGKHPYNIVCEGIAPKSGVLQRFKSGNINEDPQKIIAERNINQFPVYIDPENDTKYFVDVDILKQNI